MSLQETIYSFNGIDGDLIIKSSDNNFYRIHSNIINKYCKYISSLQNFQNLSKSVKTITVSLNYKSNIVKTVFINLYMSHYKLTYENKIDVISTQDYLNIFLLIDELQIIGQENFKKDILNNLIKRKKGNWIEFIRKIYNMDPLKEIVSGFFNVYIENLFYLKEIEGNDIYSEDNIKLKHELYYYHLMFEANYLTIQGSQFESTYY